MKTIEMLAGWILVFGGISVGLNALGVDLLGTLFDAGSGLLQVVNILIGASALWMGYKMLDMGGKKKR